MCVCVCVCVCLCVIEKGRNTKIMGRGHKSDERDRERERGRGRERESTRIGDRVGEGKQKTIDCTVKDTYCNVKTNLNNGHFILPGGLSRAQKMRGPHSELLICNVHTVLS